MCLLTPADGDIWEWGFTSAVFLFSWFKKTTWHQHLTCYTIYYTSAALHNMHIDGIQQEESQWNFKQWGWLMQVTSLVQTNTWYILSILQVTKSGLSRFFSLTNPWWFHDFYLHLLLLWLEDWFLVWRGSLWLYSRWKLRSIQSNESFCHQIQEHFGHELQQVIFCKTAKLCYLSATRKAHFLYFSLMFLFITFQMG